MNLLGTNYWQPRSRPTAIAVGFVYTVFEWLIRIDRRSQHRNARDKWSVSVTKTYRIIRFWFCWRLYAKSDLILYEQTVQK
jgi:hypothetical protein